MKSLFSALLKPTKTNPTPRYTTHTETIELQDITYQRLSDILRYIPKKEYDDKEHHYDLLNEFGADNSQAKHILVPATLVIKWLCENVTGEEGDELPDVTKKNIRAASVCSLIDLLT